MKIKCNYCGNTIEESLQTCPHCGAALSGANRMAGGTPQTIEQLRQWYVDHDLPPENVTRFFIGKNIRSPKAFGIYQDSSGDFVVYKNKANGERAIRYRGGDEAYAVNELYQRLKTEISDQKSRNTKKAVTPREYGTKSYSPSPPIKVKEPGIPPVVRSFLLIALAFFVYFGCSMVFDKRPIQGYYRYENKDYYYQKPNWYEYDQTDDSWHSASDVPEVFEEESRDYRTGKHEGKRFEDTGWYREDDDDDDWDNDSKWNSHDSWDSNDTDWDSDW